MDNTDSHKVSQELGGGNGSVVRSEVGLELSQDRPQLGAIHLQIKCQLQHLFKHCRGHGVHIERFSAATGGVIRIEIECSLVQFLYSPTSHILLSYDGACSMH